MNRNGFPCEREEEGPGRIDPVIDLTEIGQFADAARDQLMALVLWLGPQTLQECGSGDGRSGPACLGPRPIGDGEC